MVRIARIVVTVVCLVLVSGGLAAQAAPSERPLNPGPKTTTTRSTAIAIPEGTSDPARDDAYSKREARHPDAAQFRGGDGFGVYVGGSAGLVVVLLLVLLLL